MASRDPDNSARHNGTFYAFRTIGFAPLLGYYVLAKNVLGDIATIDEAYQPAMLIGAICCSFAAFILNMHYDLMVNETKIREQHDEQSVQKAHNKIVKNLSDTKTSLKNEVTDITFHRVKNYVSGTSKIVFDIVSDEEEARQKKAAFDKGKEEFDNLFEFKKAG